MDLPELFARAGIQPEAVADLMTWARARTSVLLAGLDAKTPLVFIDRQPVLLSPKDREALRDFKARMEEGGEKISFFEALRLRLGGASHLHGLAMESIASTPRLENLLHNLEQARSMSYFATMMATEPDVAERRKAISAAKVQTPESPPGTASAIN